MDLIVTHLGADFDAFAASVAALRLHPGAQLFFPGSREGAVRRMVAEAALAGIALPELRQKEIDPAALSRVILCDVRQRERIGIVAEWLAARPEIEVWAYDHHPASASDVAVAGGQVDPAAGSTSTLMAEEFRRRSDPNEPATALTAWETTLLLTGIYEDTGSLTFPSTGPRDLEAAAWLLRQGGDLGVVRSRAVHTLDATHLAVLHRMAEDLAVHRIHGHRVGFAEVDLAEHVDDLAPLVQRCLQIVALPVLLALFDEADVVTVIGRGDLPGFDLGQALAELGGGGHATAASAKVRGATLVEVRERLLAILARDLPPAARAVDLMIADPFTLPAGTTVEAAKAELNARRINAAPVTAPVASGTASPGRIVGAVTRRLLDGALQHGLGEREVERIMEPDLEWVDPQDSADAVGERMLDRHPRFLLVGDAAAGRAVGIITRMQVLRHLQGRVSDLAARVDRRAANQRESREPVAHLLKRLPEPLRSRLAAIAAVSVRHRLGVYVVGGFVRDLLLGRPTRDLDLVALEDGPRFAELLAQELGGTVRVHPAFLTAMVTLAWRDGEADPAEIDVATARSEFYRAPAALPEVQTSALRQDLYRRDFTINTLAIRLGPEPIPLLIDDFGGRKDLREKTLRILHSLSFLDDPTRALRAVRLELRLGFRMAPETERLLGIALAEGAFDRLSGSRLREELILLLDDPHLALRGLDRLQELGLLRVVHGGLELGETVRERLGECRAAFDWYRLQGLAKEALAVLPWRLLLLALALDLPAPSRVALADRLLLSGEDRRLLVGASERLAAAGETLARPRLVPHQVSEALAALAGEEILLLFALAAETGRDWIRRDLTEFRSLRLAIRGADLVAAGVPPGPRLGSALAATRRARLDGEITAAEELEFALAASAAVVASAGQAAGVAVG